MLRRHAQVSWDDDAGLGRRDKRLQIENQWGTEHIEWRGGVFTMKSACIMGLLIALFGQGCGRSPMDGGLPRAIPGTLRTGGSGGSSQGAGGSDNEGGASAASGFGGVSAGGAAGRTNATGGARGQGGVGGSESGGATGAWAACPPCLAAALKPCSPSGACVAEGHGSGMGNSTTVCYANGVRQTTFFFANGNTITAGAVVSNNGQVCLSMDQATEAWRDGTLSLKNGAGEQLALGTIAGGTITINCDGTSHVVSNACIGLVDSTACSYGTCP